MNIAIIGASGFVGRNLISHLLKNTNHNICAIDLDFKNLDIESIYKDRIKLIKLDIFDTNKFKMTLIGCHVVYYLIHMLNCKCNFYEKEAIMAETVGKVLKENGVSRVIYMSGLGNDKEKLSKHLSSRHNTGKILREYLNYVIEFRASMIIGLGSVPFEIVKDIVEKSPIIFLPKKSLTKTQPISIKDVLLYLTKAIDLPLKENIIIEIGGPEVMSYKDFIEKYKKNKRKKIPIVLISFLSEKIAGWFLSFFTSKNQAQIGQNMINSFKNEMIVTNNKAKELFPQIKTRPVSDEF